MKIKKTGTFISKAEIIINESDIEDVFQIIYITIITSIQKSLGKCLGWIIGLAIGHTINISKYNMEAVI